MATVLVIANQKGGCGKTTVTMNLAGGFTKARYRVLVVDADPQASASMWSLARGQGSLPFDVTTARQIRGDFAGQAARTDYDLILVDCASGVVDTAEAIKRRQDLPLELRDAERHARKAIQAADAVLVPLMPSTLDFSAAAIFVRYLEEHRDPQRRVLVLLNGLQSTTLISRQGQDQARVLFSPVAGARVLQSTIGRRVTITEVSGSGKTIFDYAPGHTAAAEFASLTKEIISCLTNAPASPHSQPALPTTSNPLTSHSPAEAA